MVFRDQQVTCTECGRTFFFTVTEQRRLAERTDTGEIEPPALCPRCRGESRPRPKAEPPAARERPATRDEPPPVRRAEKTPIEDAFPLEEEGVEVKLIGTVKWFSRQKGYGFITKADGTDLFFHRADISKREHVWPEDGQQVEFQIRNTDKGPEAFNVSLLPSD